jgi:uncharacterized protein
MLVLALVSSGCAAVAASPMERVASTTFVGAAHNDTSTPFNLVHLPRLIRHRYDGRALRIRHVVSDGLAVTRHHVTYRSGSLRVSGQLSVPRRPGRFPLLVLAHGYQNPATYRSGASLAREAAYLASHGYVVMQPDYRNHGESDRETARYVARPLGYPEDLVNAIRAVRRADLPFVDATRVGVLGRSMGGGVALNAVAARPGLVDALVLYSPLSSRAGDNYRRWVVGRPYLDRKVRAAYGRPVENPGFWSRASARRFAHRIDVPVQVHHGTADAVCPVRWSGATVAALRRAGQTVEYHRYPGEGHRFDEAWPVMADRVVRFFDDHV